MLKLDASLAISEIEDTELRATLAPYAADPTTRHRRRQRPRSDLILSVIPYSLETIWLIFAIADYDLGFHNRIG